MKIKSITILEVEYVAHRLTKETMKWNEPVPDFSSQFPGKLESCLAVPFQSFSGKLFFKGLIEKASMLFYLHGKKSSI